MNHVTGKDNKREQRRSGERKHGRRLKRELFASARANYADEDGKFDDQRVNETLRKRGVKQYK